MSQELYTINGNYPGKFFNFSLTPENMGMAAQQHCHVQISSINSFENSISGKADASHMHAMTEQFGNGMIITGPHDISVSVAVDGVENGEGIGVKDGGIEITYTSPRKGIVNGISNNNTSCDAHVIRFTSENIDIPEAGIGFIQFKEDTDA